MMVKNRDYIEVISSIPDLVQALEDQWQALIVWQKKAKAEIAAISRQVPYDKDYLNPVRNVEAKVDWEDVGKAFAYRLATEFPRLINSALANTAGFDPDRLASDYILDLDRQMQQKNERVTDDDGHDYPARLRFVPSKLSLIAFFNHLNKNFGGQKLVVAVHEQAAKLIDNKCAKGWYARNNDGLTRKQAFEQSFKTTKQGTDFEIRYASVGSNYSGTATQKYEWNTYGSIREVFGALEIIDQDWANEDENHVALDWKGISEQYVNENYIVFRDGNGNLVRKVELNERLTILPKKDCIGIRVPSDFAERIKAFCFKNLTYFDKADD